MKEEQHEKILQECIEKGFKPVSIEKRIKILEKQKKEIEESERCFNTYRKQLERQFTLQEIKEK